MRTYFRSAWRIALVAAGLSLPVGIVFAAPLAPAVGPNVNMVTGTQWPEGDPFLTKQNEPSLAISSRNARHLLAGANDYRLVPVEIAETLDDPEAWIQIFKSVDGGQSWRGTPLGGCPLSIPECADSTGLTTALLGLHPNFGADPTVRAGPYGTFFLSFIAGTRNTNANGVVAVQRFVDKNNDIQRATDVRPCTQGTPGCQLVTIPDGCTGSPPACTTQYLALKPAQDPILPDVLNIIDVGTPGQGKDKPWVAADVGGRSWNAGKTCELLSWTKSKPGFTPANEPNVPAFNVYVSYANFQGHSNQPDIYVAVSKDCGTTFGKPLKLTSGATKNQGTSSAIDPLTGAVYVVWRQFANPSANPPTPDAIMLSKSTDGGATWNAGKVPIQVATLHPYDQAATGVSMRTLGFPSVAVSVSGGVSRVHVAWTQRSVAPNVTAPYACPAADPAQCDARIVVATSKDGGVTWPAPVPVDSAYTVNLNLPNGSVYSHQRGDQLQPTLTFTAGKLLATWLDSRLDQSEGYLTCKPSAPGCTSVSDMVESRRPAKNSNLDPACHIDVSSPPLSTLPAATKALYDHCNHPEAVWTPYVTDGTTGLVRRHTVDVYSAMADPADAPVFTSSRVSQYTFGTTVQSVQGTVHPGDPITPKQGTYDIVQKEVNAPNLPMFSAGKSAFMGDYIDSAAQLIVATTGDSQHPYKFNVGGGASGPFVTSGFAPAFHVAFTDNRDVIPPLSGDWSSPTCITTAFKKDANGNIIGVDTSAGAACQSGYSGNRNQNVYTAAIVENSVAFANANSKALDATTERAYSVTVRNMSSDPHNYQLTLVQGPGTTASFHSATPLTQNIIVQPRSSSARTVWVKGSSTGTVEVDVKSTDSNWVPDGAFATKVLLNPDSSAALVANGDGGPATTDTAPDNFGNVVMTNAVMTNYLLANNPLTAAVMSNNAMTNAAMSNVVFSNAAMTNDAAANAAMSNVVMSNAVMTNNAMTNAVMSNVVMTNNTLNAAMTNLDPTNVAMSNAVMSNNAMTNVALTNASVGNVVMTNNAMTNAVMSNVAMSNVAMTNNAMTNDPLRYAVMTNAPLSDPSGGTVPDADPLRSVEVGAVEIAQNPFVSGDLANSNFKETTFAIRNRGNVDTTLAIKMLLRDAVCSGAPNYTCTTPPGYKLQLVLRKVSMLPVAIPPTGPAMSNIGGMTRAIRIGLTQSNVEVSNVSDLPLVDPSDPNFGKFLPDDPKAAMLTLASGEYAYATIRAIGVGGATPPDPADLLQWGVKTVASNATNANGPLVIRTLNFPAAPAFVALTAASPTLQAFGGKAPITGSVACSDQFGNIVLSGAGAPTSNVGVDGNLYIDTPAQMLYGPKTLGNWGNGRALIQPPDANHPTPWASVTCPPGPFGVAPAIGAFTTDASFNSTANITFTPTYWGDFYLRTGVADASSPTQTDQQVIKVHVNPRPPVFTYTGFPGTLTYQQPPFGGTQLHLGPLVASDSKNGAGTVQPFVFSAAGSCHVTGFDSLVIDNATVPTTGPADCIVTVHQDGNEIYAPRTDLVPIFIDRASQTIVIDFAPASLTFNNNGAVATTLAAHVTSTTAQNSGLAVTFASQTPLVCTTGGTNGADVTIVHAGTCTINADQAGNPNYKPAAPTVPVTITINPANQAIGFSALPVDHQLTFGNAPTTLSASLSSTTAPPSGLGVTYVTLTPSVCTVSGSSVTILTAGTCQIKATGGSSGDYNAPPVLTPSFIIDKASQVITYGAVPSGVTFGDSPVTVTATSVTVAPPTGTTAPLSGTPITFAAQDTTICDVTGTTNTAPGAYSATVQIKAAGTCKIDATQVELATSNYNSAPLVTQSFGIAKAPTQFTVAPQTFISFGSTPSISGTLNRPLNPTVFPANGVTATLKKNGVIVGSPYTPASAAPNGAFTVSDAGIVPENYTVTFDYAGNANFLAATSLTTALRVEGFSNTPNMSVARAGHSSTLLNDGNVLVVGGDDGTGTPPGTASPTVSAEVYCTTVAGPTCPVAGDVGTFKAVGPLATARFGHTATLLADGTVLVAGGIVDAAFNPTASAEVYCTAVAGPLCTAPSDVGTFKTVATAMQTAHAGHTATLLGDNTVLLVGGVVDNSNPPTNASEVYCTAVTGPVCTPADVGKFKSAASMTTPRDSHTATLLADGTVLVTGGEIDTGGTPTNTAEIYCSAIGGPCATADGSFKPAGSTMSSARSIHTATLLSDGRVLVAGGDDASLNSTASADVYCPLVVANCLAADVGKFKAVGILGTARAFHASALLTDGFALVAGGLDASSTALTSSELFDPAANNFAASGLMSVARSSPAATRLPDGRVLVTGGRTTGGTVVKSAELYNGPF